MNLTGKSLMNYHYGYVPYITNKEVCLGSEESSKSGNKQHVVYILFYHLQKSTALSYCIQIAKINETFISLLITIHALLTASAMN